MTAKTAAAVAREYRQALDQIRLVLIGLYEKYAVEGVLTYAEMTKFNRLQNLDKQIVEIIGPANKRSQELIEKLSKVNYEESWFRAAWSVDQAIGVNIKWGLLNPDVVNAVVGNASDYTRVQDVETRAKYMYHRELKFRAFKDVSQKAFTRIQGAIKQGMIQGASFQNMAKAISGATGKTISDAIRIARTEGMRSSAIGMQASLDAALDKGVEVVQIWDASLDDRTRPEHGALDGKEKQDKGWYSPDVGWVEGPLQSGVPSFDINCRCSVRGEIKGLEPGLRRIQGEGVVPYTTYDEWKANIEKNGGRYKPAAKIDLPEEKANFERNTGQL